MIFIVCALLCEAKPLISHLKLRKTKDNLPFSLYENGDHALIISGVGKTAAAAATAYLHALRGSKRDDIWINIGLAGGINRAIGSLFIIHKIQDQATQKNYYPTLTFPTPLEKTSLITVDRPERLYTSEALYDMEAAGFFATAKRFSTAELIHCCKVVSDNSLNSLQQLNAKKATELMENRLDEILTFSDQLLKIKQSVETVTVEGEAELLKKWHFTETEKLRLREKLVKLKLFSTSSLLNDPVLNQIQKSRDLLHYIDALIEKSPLDYVSIDLH